MPGANSLRETNLRPSEYDLDVDSPHLLKMGTMKICSTFRGERLHLCRWDGNAIYGSHKEPRLKTLCGKPAHCLHESMRRNGSIKVVDCQTCVKIGRRL